MAVMMVGARTIWIAVESKSAESSVSRFVRSGLSSVVDLSRSENVASVIVGGWDLLFFLTRDSSGTQ